MTNSLVSSTQGVFLRQLIQTWGIALMSWGILGLSASSHGAPLSSKPRFKVLGDWPRHLCLLYAFPILTLVLYPFLTLDLFKGYPAFRA